MPFNIDLHTHSFFSGDGVSSPEDLIASAQAKGLHGIAITDHNTCDAIDYLQGKETNTRRWASGKWFPGYSGS